MVAGICERELRGCEHRDPATAGEKLFRQYGVLGIRGEAEAGFPAVRNHGLPALRAARDSGALLPATLLHALIALMAEAEDTTVLWRGGPEALAFMHSQARAILSLGGALTGEGMAAIHRLDARFIARNISPGGAADLLAVAIGVDALTGGVLPPILPALRPAADPATAFPNP
jgi:triphosphoribosyl-dephospho-CoA synthase